MRPLLPPALMVGLAFAAPAAGDPYFVNWDPQVYEGCGAEVPAFPGAEGYGVEQTCGGRGGQILVVSNLDDDPIAPPPGSLRAALEAHNAQSGPSIIIFRVGGTIIARATLEIWKPNLTIAGQTAPGDGIQVRTPATDGYEDGCSDPECYENGAEMDGRFNLLQISASNVIVRHLRLRPGNDPDWLCDDDRDDDGICWGDAATTSACTPAENAAYEDSRYDNCPQTQNGPLGGTCTFAGVPSGGSPCMIDADCGAGESCSTNQEDGDGDGIGDACDPHDDPGAPDPLDEAVYPYPGQVCHNGHANMDALTIFHPNGSPRNVILDHMSFSWATDETVSFWASGENEVSNIVLQNSFISEGLNEGHKEAAYSGSEGQIEIDHGLGFLIGPNARNISIHHSVIAQHTSRCPAVVSSGALESVNNVFVNCLSTYANGRSDQQTIALNVMHNLFLPGFRGNAEPGTDWDAQMRVNVRSAEAWREFDLHVVDNVGSERLLATDPEEWIVQPTPGAREQVTAAPRSLPRIPVTAAAVGGYGPESSAFLAWLLADVGALPARRDAVDARLVSQITALHDDCMGSSWPVGCVYDGVTDPSDPSYGYAPSYGGLVNNQDQPGLGGFPVLASSAPAQDKDFDGMPNGWEGSHGFDNGDPTDGPLDADGDFYTNVEEFLNGTDPRVSEVDPNDVDYDHVPNASDNCPNLANGGQEDADGNGVGDYCSTVCSDGIDNDGDGRIDFDPVTASDPTFQAGTGDPGCFNPTSLSENPECQDGLNNDGNLGTDFDGGLLAGSADPNGPDPQCVGKPYRDAEKAPRACGLGIELALVLAGLLCLWRRAAKPS